MKFEVRKLLRGSSIILAACVLFFLNGFFFYSFVTDSKPGYSLSDISGVWDKPAVLENKIQRLEKEIEEEFNQLDVDAIDFEKIEQQKVQRNLLNAALERTQESSNYQERLSSILKDNQIKRAAGLFGNETSFNYKAMTKAYSRYYELKNVVPEVSFYGGVEAFLNWKYTDVLALAVPIVICLYLVVSERQHSGMVLAYPTVNGHTQFVVKKMRVMLIVSEMIYLLLMLQNWIISVSVCGNGPLSAPIQSVFGMSGVPFAMSVIQYLGMFVLLKVLCLFALSLLIFALAVPSNYYSFAMKLLFVLSVSFVLNTRNNLYIQTMNPIGMSNVLRWTASLEYLNFFGEPLSQFRVWIAWMILSAVACRYISLLLYEKKGPFPYRNNLLPVKKDKLWHSLFKYEGKKLYIISKGMITLCLLLGIQTLDYCQTTHSLGMDEQTYRDYSFILEGEPNKEKDAFIQNETDRFHSLYEKLERYGSMDIDESILNEVTSSVRHELLREPGFQRAKAQYEQLKDNEQYVYLSGYQKLYSKGGIKRDLLHCIAAMLTLLLVISNYVCAEFESKMDLQLKIGDVRGKTKRLKILHAAVFALFVCLFSFFFEYAIIHRDYGLHCLNASASVLSFIKMPIKTSIAGVLVITNIIRIALAEFYTMMIMKVCGKVQRLIPSVSLITVITVFPCILFYLLN